MNRYQGIALGVAVLNLLLVCLFPPWDYVSATVNRGVPTFDGFGFAFSAQPGRMLNTNFLQIVILVILANAAIAWLLLRDRKTPEGEAAPRRDWQRIVLIGTALNLILVLLFPPMQNARSVTHALLPSFDGFYFVFASQPNHVIVAPMLYLEVIFFLVNGALLYLLFRKAKPVDLQDAARAFAAEIKRR